MNHAPEYLEKMRMLVPLIRRGQKFCVWQFADICDWVAPFWNRGTISFSIQNGVGRGVCIIKLFKDLEQFLEPFVHEPFGQFVMVELMVADGPRTLGFIHDELVDRWGKREIVLWDRGEKTEKGAPRMYKWRDFEKLSRRITKYGI